MGLSGLQRDRISRSHDRLALLLGVLVPFTALPLGSNRPAWWLLWTVVFAAIAFVFLLRVALSAPQYRPRFLDHKVLLCLTVTLPFWAWVQTLPFVGTFFGVTDGSCCISVQPAAAVSGILRFAGYVLLAVLVVEIASRRDRVLRLAILLFAGICLQAVWAVVALRLMGDFSIFGPKTAYLGSATGTFVNRNSLATFLGFGIVAGIGIMAERAQRSHIRQTRLQPWYGRMEGADLLLMTGLAVLLVALVQTQSRLGLFASLIGAATTLVLVLRQAGKSWRAMAGAGLAVSAAAIAAVAVVSAGTGVADRFLLLGDEAENRLELYRQILTMIAQRPYTGFGMDAFAAGFEAFRAPPLLAPVSYDLAHNSYLMLWAEFGVVAGSAPLVALAATGVVLRRRMREPGGFSGMAAAGLGALALGAVHSAGDFSLEIPANVYVLAALLALGLGRQSRRVVAGAAPVPERGKASPRGRTASGGRASEGGAG